MLVGVLKKQQIVSKKYAKIHHYKYSTDLILLKKGEITK